MANTGVADTICGENVKRVSGSGLCARDHRGRLILGGKMN